MIILLDLLSMDLSNTSLLGNEKGYVNEGVNCLPPAIRHRPGDATPTVMAPDQTATLQGPQRRVRRVRLEACVEGTAVTLVVLDDLLQLIGDFACRSDLILNQNDQNVKLLPRQERRQRSSGERS